jgi:dienelactone hydrolase
MIRNLLIPIILLLFSISLFGQNQLLKRKALLPFRVQKTQSSPGALVTRVDGNSNVFRAGLRMNDRLFAINRKSFKDEEELLKSLRAIRAGDEVELLVLHPGQSAPETIAFKPDPAPFEAYSTLALEPITLTNSTGDQLRAFVTKPKDIQGKLPAILFVSWLSCGTVEAPERDDSWVKMLREVAEKSGCLMMRVEKPGVGDSNGTACSDCDLLTELDGYRAAWRHLKNRADVDTTRILVFGASLGGSLAALAGRDQPVAGYITAVSVYKTWLEHMIELERRRLQYTGSSQAEINSKMPGYIEFYTDYLVYKKAPGQIMREKPHLASYWYDGPSHQYGRPAEFYMQVQDINFMSEWEKTKAPMLVVAGEMDWIMSLDDSKLLVEMINAKTPGRATLNVARGMDHHWTVYPTAQDAFDETGGVYAQKTVLEMLAWIKETISK